MKIFFAAILLVLIAASCNKKNVQQDLVGTWQVYKYTSRGFDATYLFDSLHPGYTITFTNNGQFVEADTSGGNIFADAGTYTLKNNNQTLALIDSVTVQVDTLTISGLRERDYTLFGMSKNTAQLVTDSSNTYMSKK